MPGVRDVVQVPSGVAVVAEHFWAAKLGRDALEGRVGPRAQREPRQRRRCASEFRKLRAAPRACRAAAQAGDVAGGAVAKAAPRRSRPSTRCPTSRTRRWSRSTAPCGSAPTVRDLDRHPVPDRRPAGRREDHRPQAGAGRDPHHLPRRRLRPARHPDSDFVSEAVHVAKAAKAPVKVVWTREDDMRGGYYRPAYVHRARIGLGGDGMPVALAARASSASRSSRARRSSR